MPLNIASYETFKYYFILESPMQFDLSMFDDCNHCWSRTYNIVVIITSHAVVTTKILTYYIWYFVISLSLFIVLDVVNELNRQRSHFCTTEYGINSPAMRDCASPNSVALQIIKVLYPNLGCYSHTIDHVWEMFLVPNLNEFGIHWVSFFSQSQSMLIVESSYRTLNEV